MAKAAKEGKAAKEAKEASPPFDFSRISAQAMVGIVVAVHVVLVALAFDPTIFTGGDNGAYVALSRSLLERHDYVSLHDPSLAPHTLYPPGYPTILALASLAGIHPWVPIKVLAAAFSVAGVAFTALWLRRRTTPGIALLAGFLVAISPGILSQSHFELSDIPFWAIAMAVLWLLEGIPREATARAAFAGLGLALAYLTRTAGIPLVVAGLGWLAYERRWTQLAAFAAFVVPAAGGWWLWTHSHAAADPTYAEYTNVFWLKSQYQPELGNASLGDVLMRVVYNGIRYSQEIIPALMTGRGGGGFILLGGALVVLATVGVVRRLRHPTLTDVFFPLYAGMIALLPLAWGGERYLFPIFPLAIVYAAEAVLWIGRSWSPRAHVVTAAAVAAVVLMLASAPLAAQARVGSICRARYTAATPFACLSDVWQDYLSFATWAKTGLPPDAVVISRKPGLFFALSDRRGIDIPKTTDPDTYLETARKANARYLVLDRVDDLSPAYSVPVVVRYPGSFCLVKQGTVQATAVFGVLWEAERIPTDPKATETNIYPCPADFAQASQ